MIGVSPPKSDIGLGRSRNSENWGLQNTPPQENRQEKYVETPNPRSDRIRSISEVESYIA